MTLHIAAEDYGRCETGANEAAADAQLAYEQHVAGLVAQAVEDGRKLATVREISAIDDIPGADLIKVATVEGWKVVVKAGEFQPGDKCVFLEVDTFLPFSDPRYEFLRKNGITWNGIEGARLKTIRLRKQLSQGLALPLHEFPELEPYLNDPDLRNINFTGILKLMKWEKQMGAQLAGKAKGSFPSFLRKSDQERAQNMGGEIFGLSTWEHEGKLLSKDPLPGDVLHTAIEDGVKAGRIVQVGDDFYHVKGEVQPPARYEVTVKLDGSSMTVFSYTGGAEPTYGVCSRNLELKLEGNEDNAFVKTAQPIIELLKHLEPNFALQGELCGPSIQGNRENLPFCQFFVYNVFDISKGEFLTPAERRNWLDAANDVAKNELGTAALEHVPVLHECVSLEDLGITSMDELLAYADGPSLNNSVREGLVFKAVNGRHQFKVISDYFLENEK